MLNGIALQPLPVVNHLVSQDVRKELLRPELSMDHYSRFVNSGHVGGNGIDEASIETLKLFDIECLDGGKMCIEDSDIDDTKPLLAIGRRRVEHRCVFRLH